MHYTELHGDAGNIAQAFVRTQAGIPPGSTAWVLSAGKVYRDQLKERPRVFGLIGGAVSNSLYALFRADLMKLYALCAVTKSRFRLVALPIDFEVTTSAFAFNPEELVRLYQKGYEMAARGRRCGAPPRPTPCPAKSPRRERDCSSSFREGEAAGRRLETGGKTRRSWMSNRLS